MYQAKDVENDIGIVLCILVPFPSSQNYNEINILLYCSLEFLKGNISQSAKYDIVLLRIGNNMQNITGSIF